MYNYNKSVRPEVRGTFDFWQSLSPIQTVSLNTLTTINIFRCRRADRDGYSDSFNVDRRRHRLRTVLTQFEDRGMFLPLTPYDQLLGELSLARQVIHRQSSNVVHERNETLICADEVVHGALLPPIQLLSTDNGRARYYQRAPRGGCCLGAGPPLPCPPSFWLGTTPP